MRPKLEAVLTKVEKGIYSDVEYRYPQTVERLKTAALAALDKIPDSPPRPDFKAFWFILIGLGIAVCAILIRIRKKHKETLGAQKKSGRNREMESKRTY